MGNETDDSICLKLLVFQMHMAGLSQSAIAAYIGKSKTDVNRMLKPLQRSRDKE